MRKYIWIILIILIVGLLVFIIISNKEKDDEDCRLLEIESEQDQCCSDVHTGDTHILCDGEWKFVDENSRCQFVCEVG